jgi:hypothetical protein
MKISHSVHNLNLKTGEWIEVRSREDILATLDKDGRLENAPFMAEMFQYCGRRFRVFKRADKTCDPAHEPWSIRRVKNCVHLQDVRCDGQAHGGCQAGCLIFWKEAWLKRVDHNTVSADSLRNSGTIEGRHDGHCTPETISAAGQATNAEGETVYACQATELRNFTSEMAAWDPRQYIRDLTSGNLASGLAGDSLGNRVLELLLGVIRLLSSLTISLFNLMPRRLKGPAYPFIVGSLENTPKETLDLQPGELVQVRSREEIVATLDRHNRNRGMLFDGEMLPYCGGIYRVLRRVHHIIDERSGKMVNMKSPCIVLEGVVCQSDFHRLCPRAIYPYWRENWLRRASIVGTSALTEGVVETCERR